MAIETIERSVVEDGWTISKERQLLLSRVNEETKVLTKQPPQYLHVALVLVTPELAQLWLADRFERQRDLKNFHVAKLARAMTTGKFEETTIHFRVHRGEWFLTDGQHRLHAIVRSGKAQWLGVMWNIAASEDDIADAYIRTDAGLHRSILDRLVAHGDAAKAGFPKYTYLRLLRAVAVIMADFQTMPTEEQSARIANPEERFDAAVSWLEEAQEWKSLLANGPRRVTLKLWMAAPLSVALVTLRHAEVEAKEFWKTVAQDDAVSAGTPEKRLITMLTSEPWDKYHPNADARKVAMCWNARFLDRNPLRMSPQRADEPIVIAGTPYDGKLVRE